MFARALLIVAVVACLASPCGLVAAAERGTTIGLVPDAGGFSDRGYNDAAAAGLRACRAQTGVDVLTGTTKSPADYEPQLTLLTTQNADAIVALGFGMAGDLDRVARRFENARFAIVDAVVNEPNVNSVTFREQDGSFLAGALAALVSKTKRVAFLGGSASPLLERSEAGFVAGARAVDPRVRVAIRYVGSFDDAPAARAVADALFAAGSDIAYVVAGRAGRGAFDAVKARRGDYVIGADVDQDGLVPGKVLSSVVKRIDTAVLRVCRETAGGKPVSGHVELGIAEDGIGLTRFRYTARTVGAPAIARLERIRRAVASGAIVPPASRAALARFVAAAP